MSVQLWYMGIYILLKSIVHFIEAHRCSCSWIPKPENIILPFSHTHTQNQSCILRRLHSQYAWLICQKSNVCKGLLEFSFQLNASVKCFKFIFFNCPFRPVLYSKENCSYCKREYGGFLKKNILYQGPQSY